MKTKKSGADRALLMGIFTVHLKVFLYITKSVPNDHMQHFYWLAQEILKYKSNESTAGSAYFHKLTTAKTTCAHYAFGNEENFRKITSLQTIHA